MEYLFVVGFAFALLIPIIIIYYSQSNVFEEEVAISQTNKALQEIVRAADTIYYLGPPSRQTISVRFPEVLREITIQEQAITVHLDIGSGRQVNAQTRSANLTGTLPSNPGLHVITIQATDDGVLLFE